MARPKPAIAAWIARERHRLGMKPADLVARLSTMGVDISEQTVRVWESNADRRPNAYNLETLERVFASQAPRDTDTGGDLSGLVAALDRQTMAINELVARLDGLASQAIRDGIREALEEAGVVPSVGGSPASQLGER